MFYLVVILTPLLSIMWLLWAVWRTRNVAHRGRWRAGAIIFIVLMLAHFGWLIMSRRLMLNYGGPAATMSVAYVWHLFMLPLAVAAIVLGELVFGMIRLIRLLRQPKVETTAVRAEAPDETELSRRNFLKLTAVSAAPALTIIAGGAGFVQSHHFRVRRMDIRFPNLPPQLNGATIVHLSDIHAGKFTDEAMLRKIAAVANDLRGDVILMTGDLIDYSLKDLPNAVDMMRRLDSRGGVYLCEGNHDLFQDRAAFEAGVRQGGMRLLINESEMVSLRGAPVQLHGLRWGQPDLDIHSRRDGAAEANLISMQDRIDPEAFSVLLAHHPHVFDKATELGIPLTLAGHTHGGQLMLNHETGAGPMMFKYWSGLYQNENSRLVVSNGVGNWLPLRINAPAEIVHITLRA